MSKFQTSHTRTATALRDQARSAILDHDAFATRIKTCDLTRCRATCCHDGVYLSTEETENVTTLVADHPDEFSDTLAHAPNGKLFTSPRPGVTKTATVAAKERQLATDYPPHFPRTRCVFLDDQHRCAIQRLDMKSDRPAWFNKPLTCWLHPILIKTNRHASRAIITLPSPDTDPQTVTGYPGFASCTHCGRPDADGIPAHEALKPELTLLGRIADRDLIAELTAPDSGFIR